MYTQIFENVFPEVFFPFNYASGKSRIFGWMVRISAIQQLTEFLGTFPGNFCIISRRFQIFESFGWMESVHKLHNIWQRICNQTFHEFQT